MSISIFISIILLGCILAYFRYIAVWNKYKHIPISYHELLIISCGSWLTVLVSLPHYKIGDKFFQWKLVLSKYYNFKDKKDVVKCLSCDLVHCKEERISDRPKFYDSYHCPKCKGQFYELVQRFR